jgi:ribosomal protein L40E
VWRPKVSCPQCGSLDHELCDKHICLRCGSQHDPHMTDCAKDITCGRCKSSEHNSWNCPDYVQKFKTAHAAKKKSYLEALGIKKKTPSPSQPKQLPRETTSAGASLYTALSTSPLLPDIVITCLTVLESVLNLEIKDQLPAIADQTVQLLTKKHPPKPLATPANSTPPSSQVPSSLDKIEDTSDNESVMSSVEELDTRRTDHRKRLLSDTHEVSSTS